MYINRYMHILKIFVYINRYLCKDINLFIDRYKKFDDFPERRAFAIRHPQPKLKISLNQEDKKEANNLL